MDKFKKQKSSVSEEFGAGREWTKRNERFGQKMIPNRGLKWPDFSLLKGTLWLLEKK